MPLAMPMWPPVFAVVAPLDTKVADPLPVAAPLRRRWMIVDGNVRREVSETEYRLALEACHRIEIAHFQRDDVITHLCYLGAAPGSGAVAS